MWYTKTAGKITSANCQVHSDSDVSGVGVRNALYLQSAFSIILALFEQSPIEAFLSNLSLHASSFALILSGFVDSNIDAPHTIVASQLAMLLYMSRFQRFRTRGRSKPAAWAWLVDRVVRGCMLAFNWVLWTGVQGVQNGENCPEGFGKWVSFWEVRGLDVSSAGTRFAGVFCVADITWEASLVVSEFTRAIMLSSRSRYFFGFLG
jgi:hypothetical protein